jgi:uncharacterized membrane protein YbhN (UPF0104 family)
MDRAVGATALIGLVLVSAVVLSAGRSQIVRPGTVLGLAGALAGVGLAVWAWLSRQRNRQGDGPVRRAAAAFASHQGWLATGRAFLIAIGTHLLNAANFVFAFSLLHVQANGLRVMLLAPLVILASTLPLAPLGLGVADAMAAAVYAAAGNSAGAAATMLIRVVSVSVSAVCGLALLRPPAVCRVVEPEAGTGPGASCSMTGASRGGEM